MLKKRKRKARHGIIPKDWSTKNGITVLPIKIQNQLQAVFDKLRIGEDVRGEAFFRKLTEGQKTTVAHELALAGICHADIGMLLGVTIQGAYAILDRARREKLTTLGPTWIAANIIGDREMLDGDAAWFRARSESAVDDSMAAEFRRGAVSATGKAADMLLKAGEIAKSFKPGGDGEPDPSDRETTLTWAYEHIIVPKLAAPKPEEAEIVAEVVDEK